MRTIRSARRFGYLYALLALGLSILLLISLVTLGRDLDKGDDPREILVLVEAIGQPTNVDRLHALTEPFKDIVEVVRIEIASESHLPIVVLGPLVINPDSGHSFSAEELLSVEQYLRNQQLSFERAHRQRTVRNTAILFMSLLLALATFGGYSLWRGHYRAFEELEQELERLEQLANRIPDRTLNALIDRESNTLDLLNEAHRILYWHEEEKRDELKTLGDSLDLARNILRLVETRFGVCRLEEYNSETSYQSSRHTAFEAIEEGEKVRVVETGWIHQGEILKKALVKRISWGPSPGDAEQ